MKTGKRLRIAGICVVVWLATLTGYLFAPRLFCEKVGSIQNITLWSASASDPKQTALLLQRVIDKLQKLPYHFSQNDINVYITGNGLLYRVYAGSSADAFAAYSLPLDATVVGRADINTDLVFRNDTIHNVRTLSSVVVHEITHQILRRELGLWDYLQVSTWKNEGLCDYIAGDTTFPYEQAVAMLGDGRADQSKAFQYATYCIVVRHMLEEEGMTVQQLLDDERSFGYWYSHCLRKLRPPVHKTK